MIVVSQEKDECALSTNEVGQANWGRMGVGKNLTSFPIDLKITSKIYGEREHTSLVYKLLSPTGRKTERISCLVSTILRNHAKNVHTVGMEGNG